MQSKVKALWIDDTDRSEDARNLQNASLLVEYIRPENLERKLPIYIKDKNSAPDIYLVDYFLGLISGNNNQKFKYNGLTIAAIIREHYPEYPIYLVTAVEHETADTKLSLWAQAANVSFDEILTLKEVQRNGMNFLYFDAMDFKAIRKATKADIGTLFKLLNAHKNIQEKLALVLPDELRSGLSSGVGTSQRGNAIAFAKWVRGTLLVKAGFLYNRLRTATYLGMNIANFNKIASSFSKALYSGVFSRSHESLWWVSELDLKIFSYAKAQRNLTINPWEIAPSLFKIPNSGTTKCGVCGKRHPETVGVNVDDNQDYRPVHYCCSEPYYNEKREPYFDEPRSFKLRP